MAYFMNFEGEVSGSTRVFLVLLVLLVVSALRNQFITTDFGSGSE